MTYPFDTTTTDDLTDAEIEAAIAACKGGYSSAYIALARLMRDHPELFEEPVDPDVLAVREAMAKQYEKVGNLRTAEDYRRGEWDKTHSFRAALDLLRAAKGGAA